MRYLERRSQYLYQRELLRVGHFLSRVAKPITEVYDVDVLEAEQLVDCRMESLCWTDRC
jgi:hypothetical protein